MNFVNVLNDLKNSKALDVIKDEDRDKLYDIVTIMGTDEAAILYKDLCYLYICVVNEQIPEQNQLTLLSSNYKSCFIRSLIDVGSLIDKIADAASSISVDIRSKKLESERQQRKSSITDQQENASFSEKWSSFLLASRKKNKLAYELTQKQIQNYEQTWQKIICMEIDILKSKPPIFFHGLQTKNLTIQQKRALIYKLTLVKSANPKYIQERINTLTREVFEYDDIDNSSEANMCSCTSRCTIL